MNILFDTLNAQNKSTTSFLSDIDAFAGQQLTCVKPQYDTISSQMAKSDKGKLLAQQAGSVCKNSLILSQLLCDDGVRDN